MKQQVAKKVVSGLIMGCLTLSFGALALAHSGEQGPMPGPGMMQEDRPHPEDRQQHINKALDKLATDGTITQDQVNKLKIFFREKDTERRADLEKMKDMSPEDRDTYLKEKFKNHPDSINDIKTAAELSEEQAKAVAEALRPPHVPNPDGPRCPMMPNP
ncbi:hypothetical protein [Pelosinus sp. IPA-1]|uniref:hypothetical protein n=1 Tax=Pelosinus sp. IPA-1 TaxID=3029569 RepID=UPI0024362B3C|nr:hypothetical protein [Pelosinus sp. IPA-1]GMB01232.1 hypothetical protein PIPA1_40310 [Pelosinus sp. IPA-1]